MPGALNNIRIIDLSQALAGPYCTMLLADMGADVIKIEPPDQGDQSRGWGPPFVEGESTYFLGINRNKRSLTLNIKAPAGQEILHRLIAQADVCVCNIPKEESRRRAGLDAATLQAVNPRLIYCLISGYGSDGPYAERPGYDMIAQGEAGIMSITGEIEGGPMRFPISIADMATGMYSVMGILAALYAREQSGRGQVLDMTLLESQSAWLMVQAASFFNAGKMPSRIGNAHQNIVPYNVFATASKHIIVAVGTEKLWSNFCDSLELSQLKTDPRFTTNASRVQHRAELVSWLQDFFLTQPAEYWLEKLQAAGVPSGPINTIPDTLAHPQHQARQFIVPMEHATLGPVKTLGNPIRLCGTPVSYRLPPPTLGQHTAAILAELGYEAEAIARLQEQGVV